MRLAAGGMTNNAPVFLYNDETMIPALEGVA